MTPKTSSIRMVLVAVFVLAVILGSAPQNTRAAGTWYVAPSGSDSNACDDPAVPCATINAALGKASAGDLIQVAEGVYTSETDPVVLVNKDIHLSGGWDSSFSGRVGLSVVDGQDLRRAIQIDAGVVQMEYFRIEDGYAETGGGIANSGDLTVNNCEIFSNTAYFGAGGGVLNYANLAISESSLEENSATYGGAMSNSGTLAGAKLSIVDNYAGQGAGLSNYGVATLNESHVNQNESQGGGSALVNWSGTLTVTDSRIDHNRNLAIVNDFDDELILNNSAVYGNIGGGIWNYGIAILNNSTVSGNSGGPPWFDVGGITNYGTFSINSSTITGNSSAVGGGINSAPFRSVTLRNTILAGNSAPSGPDCSGEIESEGYNLVSDLSGCDFIAAAGDQTGVDPELTGLLGKLGSPPYHALLPGSPAVDAGNPSGCVGSEGVLDADQRGASRVGRCDVGAYEYTLPGAASIIQASGGSPQHAPPGAAFAQNLQATILDDLGTPVDLVTVTFTAPAGGPSGTFDDTGTSSTAVESQPDGTATAPVFTANAERGSYLVSASLPGGGSADFSLGNFSWYVKPTGNDADDCQTPATACVTVTGAMLKPEFIPGEKVYVASGVYIGSDDFVLSLEESVFLSGGWNTAFTQQEGYSVVDGQNARQGIYVAGFEDVWLEHFELRNGFTDGTGGGVLNHGSLTLDTCKIKNNQAVTAGAIYNGGTLTLEGCTITENSSGSAILTEYGRLNIFDSQIHHNLSEDQGHGIYNQSGQILLRHSIIRDHPAHGIFSQGGQTTLEDSLIAANQGAGISINDNGGLHLSSSVIRGNGGGGIVGGSLYLENCTIADNGPAEEGGGIAYAYGYVYNCTIAGNQAATGGGIAGNTWATLTLHNTIVAGNSADSGPDCAGPVASAGFNLLANPEGCEFTSADGDLLGLDPGLGTFESTAGVFPLLPESAPVNAGDPAGCTGADGELLEADQRGLPRFGRCDIGSYELQPLGFSTLTANVTSAFPGDPVDFTLSVRNPGYTGFADVQVVNTLPEKLDFVEGSLVASRGEAHYTAGVISWAGPLEAEDEVTIHYTALIAEQAPVGSAITNSAEISSNGEFYLRSVEVQLPPYRVFGPCVTRACLRSLSDDFSNPASGWPTGDDGDILMEYLDGEYRILVRPEESGMGVRHDFRPADFTATVDVRNATGRFGSYGLIFGLDDFWSNFYSFEIYPDGYFGIYRFDPYGVTALMEDPSPAILQGTASNRLTVERSGASIKAYANGHLVADISDATLTGFGYIGLIVFSYDQSNVDIFFDNFNAVAPECLTSAVKSKMSRWTDSRRLSSRGAVHTLR